MGAFYHMSSRILVWILEYFGRQKSSVIVFICLQFFGYILVHLLCDCFVQIAVHSHLQLGSYTGYMKYLWSVFTQFLPTTPTFFPARFVYDYSLISIFARLCSIFAIYVASSFTFLSRWWIIIVYIFIKTSAAGLGLFAVSLW